MMKKVDLSLNAASSEEMKGESRKDEKIVVKEIIVQDESQTTGRVRKGFFCFFCIPIPLCCDC